MGFLIKELVGLVLWLLANWAYVGARRTGRHGFARLVAFWIGFPGTMAALFLVPEGSQPALAPPPDDEEALLDEVRRSRRLPAGEDAPGTTHPKTEEETR